MKLNLSEKIEIIYESYTRTLDYDIACLRADLTDKEREKVDADEMLHYRMKLHDADVQEGFITTLKDLADSDDVSANVKLRATLELGSMFYKKRFVEKIRNDDTEDIPDVIVLKGKKVNA